jgi:N-dimethylarginine dimethylaminohydrolase
MKKLLLCPPTFFNIEYEINPWMHIENKVTQKSASDEYNILKQTYQNLGSEILEIEPVQGLPDMVYTANLGFIKDDIFIVANFKHPQRQKESYYSEEYFKKLGFKIKKLPPQIAWEGEGDFLKVGNKYFMGHNKRSDLRAAEYLAEILQGKVIPLKLIDPYFYHLDMCFFPLDEKTVSINPKSFDSEGLKTIHEHFKTVIESSPEDNQYMASNAEVIDKTIVVAEGITNELKQKYSSLGFTTKEIPMDEYRKGGGSIKCLTLEFH